MLRFEQLQAVMGKLRFNDDMALRTIGLAKLAKVYDVYPMTEDGRKLYCLLPKGMDVAKAKQLTQAAAMGQVVVLQETGKSLAKVWPNDEAKTAPVAPAAAAAVPAAAPAEPARAGGLGELVEE